MKYRVVRIDPAGHAVVVSRHRVYARALTRAAREARLADRGIVHVETEGEPFQWSGLPWSELK